MAYRLPVTAAVCLWALATPARAEPPDPLRFDVTEAVAVDTTLALGFVSTHYLTDPPDTCSVCNAASFEVDAARAFGSEDNAYAHHVWSTWLLRGMLVAGAGFSFGAGADEGTALTGLEDLFAVTEAVVATEILTRTAKILVQRRRPGVLLDVPSARIEQSDASYSFFSGHASVSAAATMAIATVAELRGYPWKYAAGIVGATLSLTIGLARLASYRHWLSDVMVGWVVGAATGVLVPYLLHGNNHERTARAQSTAPSTLPLVMTSF